MSIVPLGAHRLLSCADTPHLLSSLSILTVVTIALHSRISNEAGTAYEYALTGVAGSQLTINHTQCCDLRSQMPFWKPKFKLLGRVFAILRMRPTVGKEESRGHLKATAGLAGHDCPDLPSTSIPTIHFTSTHADHTIAQSSPDDFAHHADAHPRYENCFFQCSILTTDVP